MFGFSKNGEAGKAKEKAAIEFLAALLVSYPEFYSASYLPETESLEIDFVLQGDAEAGEGDLPSFPDFLKESIETYHALTDGIVPEVECHGERMDSAEKGKTVVCCLTRDFESLTRGELTMIADILVDRFKDVLILDGNVPQRIDDTFSDYESNVLDKMLGEMPKLHLKKTLIGLREEDRVVVYNK